MPCTCTCTLMLISRPVKRNVNASNRQMGREVELSSSNLLLLYFVYCVFLCISAHVGGSHRVPRRKAVVQPARLWRSFSCSHTAWMLLYSLQGGRICHSQRGRLSLAGVQSEPIWHGPRMAMLSCLLLFSPPRVLSGSIWQILLTRRLVQPIAISDLMGSLSPCCRSLYVLPLTDQSSATITALTSIRQSSRTLRSVGTVIFSFYAEHTVSIRQAFQIWSCAYLVHRIHSFIDSL